MWDGAGKDSVYGNKGNDRYYVNSNRKEFKDRDTGDECEAEPTYSYYPGSGGLIATNLIGAGAAGILYATSSTVLGGTLQVANPVTAIGTAALNPGAGGVLTLNPGAGVSTITGTTGGSGSVTITTGSGLIANIGGAGSTTDGGGSTTISGTANGGVIFNPVSPGGSTISGPGTFTVVAALRLPAGQWKLSLPAGSTVVGPDGASRTVEEGATIGVAAGSKIDVGGTKQISVQGALVTMPTSLVLALDSDATATVTGGAADSAASAVKEEAPPAPTDDGTTVVGIGNESTEGGLAPVTDPPAGAGGTITVKDGLAYL
jgi:hypothetical protein